MKGILIQSFLIIVLSFSLPQYSSADDNWDYYVGSYDVAANDISTDGQITEKSYSEINEARRRHIPDIPYIKICRLFRTCHNEIGYELMDIYKEYDLNYDTMFEDINCRINPEFVGRNFMSYITKKCRNYSLLIMLPILLHFKEGGPEKIKIVTKVANSYTFYGGLRALSYIKKECMKPEIKNDYACRTDRKGIATLAIALRGIFHAKP